MYVPKQRKFVLLFVWTRNALHKIWICRESWDFIRNKWNFKKVGHTVSLTSADPGLRLGGWNLGDTDSNFERMNIWKFQKYFALVEQNLFFGGQRNGSGILDPPNVVGTFLVRTFMMFADEILLDEFEHKREKSQKQAKFADAFFKHSEQSKNSQDWLHDLVTSITVKMGCLSTAPKTRQSSKFSAVAETFSNLSSNVNRASGLSFGKQNNACFPTQQSLTKFEQCRWKNPQSTNDFCTGRAVYLCCTSRLSSTWPAK